MSPLEEIPSPSSRPTRWSPPEKSGSDRRGQRSPPASLRDPPRDRGVRPERSPAGLPRHGAATNALSLRDELIGALPLLGGLLPPVGRTRSTSFFVAAVCRRRRDSVPDALDLSTMRLSSSRSGRSRRSARSVRSGLRPGAGYRARWFARLVQLPILSSRRRCASRAGRRGGESSRRVCSWSLPGGERDASMLRGRPRALPPVSESPDLALERADPRVAVPIPLESAPSSPWRPRSAPAGRLSGDRPGPSDPTASREPPPESPQQQTQAGDDDLMSRRGSDTVILLGERTVPASPAQSSREQEEVFIRRGVDFTGAPLPAC